MSYQINISGLTVATFGYERLNIYRPLDGKLQEGSAEYFPHVRQEEFEGVNLLGLPVQMAIKFDDVVFQGKKYKGPLLLDPICQLTESTNIVSTSIQGRPGTVKEYISEGDWNLSLQGLIVSSNIDMPPTFETAEFKNYFNLPIAKPVSNRLLNSLGIFYLVKTDIQFPAINHMMGVQPYSLELISDTPIELIINE
jgi:hypothetical protein